MSSPKHPVVAVATAGFVMSEVVSHAPDHPASTLDPPSDTWGFTNGRGYEEDE